MAFPFLSHWNLPFGYFIYDLMNILTKNILAKTTWFFQASGLEFQTFHVDLSSLSDLENEGLLVETFNVHYFTTHAHAILPCRYMWSPCTVQEIVKMGKKVYTHMLLLLILLTQKCTQKETLEESCQAASQRKPVNGIKGPSWFCGLKHHNIINGQGIDYMHCDLLCVCKCLLDLWFDSGETRRLQIKILHFYGEYKTRHH